MLLFWKLFITVSANLKSDEITNNLKIYKTSHNQSNIINRVFKLKLNNLIDNICNEGILDYSVAFYYVIKY